MKPHIIHIIDSLLLGGAETLLVGVIPLLSKVCHNTIITLKSGNNFKEELEGINIINLDHSGAKKQIPSIVLKLKGILEKQEISVIHTHLYWSTIIGRLACPKGVELVTTYHSLLYDPNNFAQFSKKMLLLDKLTYKKRYKIIYISEEVKENVSRSIGIKENHNVIYNYISDEFYENTRPNFKGIKEIKAVAVGNFRPEKDYPTLITALGSLGKERITLDIFGDGELRKKFEQIIEKEGVNNVILKGRNNNIVKILPHYHLFIMGSIFEGFGIALAEAMATGLPCLVSDIPSFKEVTKGNAFYFKAGDSKDLVNKLNVLLNEPNLLSEKSQKAFEVSKSYSKTIFLDQLKKVYGIY